MGYVKQNWRNYPSESTPISADRLAHMETQYDEAIAYFNDNSPGQGDAGVYNPRMFDVPGDGVTSASTSLQQMLDNIPPGSTVRFDPRDVYNLTSVVTLNKSVTLLGGRFKANPSGSSFKVAADDVTLSGGYISGSASSVINSMYLIEGAGTKSSPIHRLRIVNYTLTGSGYAHIWLSWVKDFKVVNNHLFDAQYVGVMLISPKTGVVEGNTVRYMRMSAPLVNCYGIAATDLDNDLSSRAEDVLIIGNYVDGMTEWEGIDTHGGKNISVIGNTVRNCRTPIAITTGNVSRVVPPESCTVTGNYVEKGVASSETAGIVFNGKSGGTLPDRIAHGTIGHNVIRGFQKDLILDLYDRDRTSVAPQSHDGPIRRSPAQQVFRDWGANTTISVTSAPGGSRTLSFPVGYFSSPPVVTISKSGAAGARHVPYVDSVTAESCTIGVYDPTGGTASVTVPVTVRASQMGALGNGVSYV